MGWVVVLGIVKEFTLKLFMVLEMRMLVLSGVRRGRTRP